MPAGIHPIITTPDLERAQRFYTGLLDAEEAVRHPEEGPVFFVGLRVGDSELGLVVNSEAQAPGPVLLSAEVPDVDALLGRVEQLGGRVLGPPNDMPWGQRVAHVHDPDGNMLNLTQGI